MMTKEDIKAYKEKAIDWIYNEDGGISGYVDGELYLFPMLRKIIAALEEIEKTSEEIFPEELTKANALGGANKKQAKIISAIRINPFEIQKRAALFNLNPKILAWIRVRGSIEIPCSIDDEFERQEFFEKVNEFLVSLKRELSDPCVKMASKNLERASNKNHKSLMDYIDNLFMLYSRLLVVRIDLGYKKFTRTACSDSDEDSNYLHTYYGDINSNREKLISHVRSAKKEYSMVGYAWKLEYGAAKGYHYHVIFFLDGSKVRQDISVAQRIGQYWNDEVTNGDGIHFICNINKDYYKMCGVGMISHAEVDKINNLKRASTYLTKVDRIIYTCVPGRARCFGKGEIPKRPKTAGRPRKTLT